MKVSQKVSEQQDFTSVLSKIQLASELVNESRP